MAGEAWGLPDAFHVPASSRPRSHRLASQRRNLACCIGALFKSPLLDLRGLSMEATSAGPNRTGAALNPKDIQQMLKAVDELSPPVPINTLQMDVERQT